jgi:hypothetical protein
MLPGPRASDIQVACQLAADRWLSAFDEFSLLEAAYETLFGVPMRAELKAYYLIRNGGDIRNLGHAPGQRYLIYRAQRRVLATLSARGFAIVFYKTKCQVTF